MPIKNFYFHVGTFVGKSFVDLLLIRFSFLKNNENGDEIRSLAQEDKRRKLYGTFTHHYQHHLS